MISVEIREKSELVGYITASPEGSGVMSHEDRDAGWCFYRYVYSTFPRTGPEPGRVGTVKHLPSNGLPALLKEIFEDLETKGAT